MTDALTWLSLPLFALSYWCFKQAYLIWKSDQKYQPIKFENYPIKRLLRKAVRKARRLTLSK